MVENIQLGMRVKHIHKLPDCVPTKGEGTVIAITQLAPVVEFDSGEIVMVYIEDLEEVQ